MPIAKLTIPAIAEITPKINEVIDVVNAGGGGFTAATAAEVNAGTNNTKGATPLALKDSNYIFSNNGTVSDIITLTKAAYDALTPAEKVGKTFITIDEPESTLAIATVDEPGLMSSADRAFMNNLDTYILNKFFPIGKLYFSEDSTNPGTILGGTWIAWGQGRMPMGVGSIAVNTDTTEGVVTAGAINKVSAGIRGGEKAHVLAETEMPAHDHEETILQGATAGSGAWDFSGNAIQKNVTVPNNQGIQTGPRGGGLAHNNLSPYITCYMWKRTA